MSDERFMTTDVKEAVKIARKWCRADKKRIVMHLSGDIFSSCRPMVYFPEKVGLEVMRAFDAENETYKEYDWVISSELEWTVKRFNFGISVDYKLNRVNNLSDDDDDDSPPQITDLGGDDS